MAKQHRFMEASMWILKKPLAVTPVLNYFIYLII